MNQDNPELPGSLVRFFITLPEPVPLPDGYTFFGIPGGVEAPEGGQPFVHLIFRQSEGVSRRLGSLDAAAKIAKGGESFEQYAIDISDAQVPRGKYTTVIATTLAESKRESGGKWVSVQDIPPSQDAFNRCIVMIGEIVRAYRTAFDVPCAVPTYEQLDMTIMYQRAKSGNLLFDAHGFLKFDESAWGERGVLVLEHRNFPDFPQGEGVREDEIDKLVYFGELLGQGSPLFCWKERFVEARRALNFSGDYAAAVTLSITASEVLLDGVLGLLFWELGENPESLADFFAEGRLVRRIKSRLPELLGGRWSLDDPGPVSEWFNKAFRLRHRVVHGGYWPSRLEADVALEAVHSLSVHCWDRIAEKRNSFPRTALMTISEPGLRKRNKWCRNMEHFAKEVAPTEDSWLQSFQKWRSELYNALLLKGA